MHTNTIELKQHKGKKVESLVDPPHPILGRRSFFCKFFAIFYNKKSVTKSNSFEVKFTELQIQ